MIVDKIKAFFKWYQKGMDLLLLKPKPEAKGAEKKAVEPPETKVAKAPGKKVEESSSK